MDSFAFKRADTTAGFHGGHFTEGGVMRFISPSEAARVLHFHEESIRRMLRNGSLPGRKLGGRWQVDMEAVGLITNQKGVISGKN